MATCINQSVADRAMIIFSTHVRAGLGFFKASNLTVKAMNKEGNLINKEDFDIIARSRYNEVIPNEDYHVYINKQVGKLNAEIYKLLGITGKWNTKGKAPKANEIGPEAQDKLVGIKEAILNPKNQEHYDNLPIWSKIIVDLINDGEYDHHMLTEAIGYLKEIRETGASELEARVEAQEKEYAEAADTMVESLNRVSVELQGIAKLATEALNNEDMDVQELVEMAEANGIKIPDHATSNRAIGRAIFDAIDKRNRHWAAGTRWEGLVRLIGDYSNYVFDDLGYMLGRLDFRGAKKADQGVLESQIDNEIRKGKNQTLKAKQDYVAQLGTLIAESYDIELPNFKSLTDKLSTKSAVILKQQFYMQTLQEMAINSALKIETGLDYKTGANKGRQIVLSKGDLMQLYVDVLNPDVERSMELTGISRNDLEVLANKHLTEVDKKFAMRMASEFYQEMWEKENAEYRKAISHQHA